MGVTVKEVDTDIVISEEDADPDICLLRQGSIPNSNFLLMHILEDIRLWLWYWFLPPTGEIWIEFLPLSLSHSSPSYLGGFAECQMELCIHIWFKKGIKEMAMESASQAASAHNINAENSDLLLLSPALP